MIWAKFHVLLLMNWVPSYWDLSRSAQCRFSNIKSCQIQSANNQIWLGGCHLQHRGWFWSPIWPANWIEAMAIFFIDSFLNQCATIRYNDGEDNDVSEKKHLRAGLICWSGSSWDQTEFIQQSLDSLKSHIVNSNVGEPICLKNWNHILMKSHDS